MTSIPRMFPCIKALLIIGITFGLLLLGRTFAAEPGVLDRSSEFAVALRSLIVEADIDTNNDFDKYKRDKNIVPSFIAPRGLRSFAQPPQMQTWSRIFLGFRWDEGRISLSWTGELRIVGNHDDSRKKLFTAMQDVGFSDSTGKLTTHLAEEYEGINKGLHSLAGSSELLLKSFVRPIAFANAKETVKQEVLIDAFSGMVGGREESSGSEFEWCAAIEYPHAAPTLSDLLTALPAIQPVHFEPALYERLHSEPVYCFRTDCTKHRPGVAPNSGWRLQTSAAVRTDIEELLEKQGFVREGERKLAQVTRYGERLSITWRRNSDSTYLHVITRPSDKERIQISCQAPQRAIKP
jgi:hypothetical protein